MDLDLVLLVAPSLLFALLQYKSSAHSQEVKLIRENLEKFLGGYDVKKMLLQKNQLKESLDAVLTFKPKGIGDKLLWSFVAYLLLVSVTHCAAAFGWNVSDITLWKSADADGKGFYLKIESLFSVYMVLLAVATCVQIWGISREKKKITKANTEAEGQVKVEQSML
ncbi:MAG: hypothetical protein MPK31_01795 [Gammaproteobacteria bacterium]|nr:hypothetical protein [Gammaproteobacteria bacterium]MDA8015513.1 hypothetical protein [Gammaproteobacteria bacterium]